MIGERLQELRKDAGLTQDELAIILSINKHSISSYERDKIEPPDTIKIAMAQLFHVSVDYLLGREKTALQTERWLDESYCGKLSRRQLLELCEALPAEKRRLLHGFLYLLGQEETKA